MLKTMNFNYDLYKKENFTDTDYLRNLSMVTGNIFRTIRSFDKDPDCYRVHVNLTFLKFYNEVFELNMTDQTGAFTKEMSIINTFE